VLNFSFDRSCFHSGEVCANFGVSNNIHSVCISNSDAINNSNDFLLPKAVNNYVNERNTQTFTNVH